MSVAPYGSWRSPITSDLIATGSIRLGEVSFQNGVVYWLESRPTEEGRYVVMRRKADGTIEDATPPGTNARTMVHEYGGGAYLVAGDTIFFTDWSDQRLYRRDRGDDPWPITPQPEIPYGLRYADARLTPDGRTIVAVRERHDGTHEAVNELVSFAADGSGSARVIAAGRDFYSFPRVSPDGSQIAWTEWDHPNMPWDDVYLMLADLAPDGSVANPRHIAGGPGESIFQPEWSPEGVLHFVSDRTGWWNIYRLDGDTITPVAPLEAEFGTTQWVFGMSQYTFVGGGRIACAYTQHGEERLGVIEPGSGVVTPLDTPFNTFAYLAGDGSGRLALLAGGATLPMSVVLMDVRSGAYETLRRSGDDAIDPAYISVAQAIEFPTANGLTAHAFYYPPVNPEFSGPQGELPPLIVASHGGPTGATTPELDLSTQFWTSRGFAVVDVNYGGSSGYGREYRNRLRGNWGIVDIEDCVNAAKYLAGQGLVDGSRLAIHGGSAGGYTTLAALTFTDVFSAGASYYGISDLETMTTDTHKFESRYLDGLVGPYPEAIETYKARSPINHTDRLSCPMIIFQGLEDKVVPPSQAEVMVEALKAKGLPYAYLPYEGEQHGFRKAENIKRSLDAELYFYGWVFNFTPADEIEPVEIVH
ncbi:MAG: peptidase [Chloroflexi bacterium]|nr:MAG: peptidase [Chloroflexota bacterium]